MPVTFIMKEVSNRCAEMSKKDKYRNTNETKEGMKVSLLKLRAAMNQKYYWGGRYYS